MISRTDAKQLLASMTESASLLRHMRTLELVMEAYAEKLGEDQDEWAVTGLLHDADYEPFPEKHPQVIVEKLRGKTSRTGGREDCPRHLCALYKMGRFLCDNP